MTQRAVSNPWLICRQPNPQARLRLLCFPYAGGGASIYRTWFDFAPGVEVSAVQLPGRDERIREKPIGDMTTLVDALVKGLEGSLGKPYALFGYSMGALIAYELVRRLRARGGPLPVHVFVSARRTPHIVGPEAPIRGLREPEFVNQLVRRYNGIPPAVLREPDLMGLFLPILRSDFR